MCPIITFLEIELDTISMEMHLPQDRLNIGLTQPMAGLKDMQEMGSFIIHWKSCLL